jgi:hypothetical protein
VHRRHLGGLGADWKPAVRLDLGQRVPLPSWRPESRLEASGTARFSAAPGAGGQGTIHPSRYNALGSARPIGHISGLTAHAR